MPAFFNIKHYWSNSGNYRCQQSAENRTYQKLYMTTLLANRTLLISNNTKTQCKILHCVLNLKYSIIIDVSSCPLIAVLHLYPQPVLVYHLQFAVFASPLLRNSSQNVGL